MREVIQTKIKDSSTMRWFVVALVSITMMSGYFLTDVIAPLKSMMEQELQWTSTDYGIFTSGYGWLNIFIFMLIISGIILDKLGIRFTGLAATLVMIAGASLKYWAISSTFENPSISLTIGSWTVFDMNRQVLFAALGYALFGVGVEAIGITATKAIVKWFKGREMALALGINVATARIGTAMALYFSPRIANEYGLNAPLLGCLIFLCIGLLSFIAFSLKDSQHDKRYPKSSGIEEENFKVSDILIIIKNKGFWYIAALCILFYSGVFPFLKYASDLMVNKFGMAKEVAGDIPAILPIGNMILTPLFGYMYDKKGKGASIMIFGSSLLIIVHLLFALPVIDQPAVAVVLMFMLGVAFSLVPSAMWPSVPKIIDENKLGTAYSLIFWIQNWGLSGVPLLIGYILDKYCVIGHQEINGITTTAYDYTIPMLVFASFGAIGLIFAFLLKREDRIKGYGLENPNITK